MENPLTEQNGNHIVFEESSVLIPRKDPTGGLARLKKKIFELVLCVRHYLCALHYKLI